MGNSIPLALYLTCPLFYKIPTHSLDQWKCRVNWSTGLLGAFYSAPSIQLRCQHYCHSHCVRKLAALLSDTWGSREDWWHGHSRTCSFIIVTLYTLLINNNFSITAYSSLHPQFNNMVIYVVAYTVNYPCFYKALQQNPDLGAPPLYMCLMSWKKCLADLTVWLGAYCNRF